MNKSQELEALTRFIQSLPQDSYLRPALAESAPFFSAAIRCDVNFDFAGRARQLAAEWRDKCETLQAIKTHIEIERKALEQLRRDTLYARRELQAAIEQLSSAADTVCSALAGAKRDLKQAAA